MQLLFSVATSFSGVPITKLFEKFITGFLCCSSGLCHALHGSHSKILYTIQHPVTLYPLEILINIVCWISRIPIIIISHWILSSVRYARPLCSVDFVFIDYLQGLQRSWVSCNSSDHILWILRITYFRNSPYKILRSHQLSIARFGIKGSCSWSHYALGGAHTCHVVLFIC